MVELQKNSKTLFPANKTVSFSITIVYSLLCLWCITTFFPLAWVLNNSFQSSTDIMSNSLKITTAFSIKNYIDIFGYMNIGRGFANSFIISGSVILFVSLLGGLASFVMARFEFKGKKVVDTFLFASMLIPQFALIVPVFKILRELKLYGSHFALIIPHAAVFLPFTVLILTGFMSSIPREMEEAALVEGASVIKIFFKIIAPLSIPAFSTTAILIFLWSYNDLLMAMVYLPQKTLQPVSVILAQVSSTYGTNYGALMAAVIVTIVPILVLYTLSQEYVIKGLTAGAVKG